MVVSDIYFNVSMIIIEETTFQINSFTSIFLGKDVVINVEYYLLEVFNRCF